MKQPSDVARRRAERGYRWLRTKGPKYGLDVERVSTTRIDMNSPTMCVLAQSTIPPRTFNQAVEQIWPHSFIRAFMTRRYGFILKRAGWLNPTDRQGVSYRLLEVVWADVIFDARNKEKEMANA